MPDKSPHKTTSKKVGKSIKEKRAAKNDKKQQQSSLLQPK